MKKILLYFVVIVLSIFTFYLAYDYKNNQEPKSYYKVYLNNEELGVIDSEEKLNKYIDKQSENIKNKFNVDIVYSPVGLNVEKISSYNEVVSSVDDIFNRILDKSALTISGYQINIKKDEENTISLYVIDENIFKTAVEDMIKTFVGSDDYTAYINKTQQQIVDTGKIIENIYVQNDITIKKVKLPVDQKIYTNEQDLSQYLLFGNDFTSTKYIVEMGDTISKVASANKISTEEFLISNPQFTDKTNLLHVGQEVTIAVTNPQLKVIEESYEVIDKEETYALEERYDSSQYVGYEEVVQNGENGVLRVTQRTQMINGNISYIDPVDKEELKPAIPKIVVIGDKYIANVGDVKNWKWPSNPGYTISDDFEWRTNPITGKREHHSGIDISGTGYGSPIYAANNGVIEKKTYSYDWGYYILINHNNSYWTLYAHMSRFASVSIGQTVERGQVIGYVGSTGYSTGPHLHFEVWKDKAYNRINPLLLFR